MPLRRARRSPPARREAVARVASNGPTRYALLLLLLFLLLLHFSSTEEARANNGSGLRLRKSRKWGWMEEVFFLKEQGPKRRRFGACSFK